MEGRIAGLPCLVPKSLAEWLPMHSRFAHQRDQQAVRSDLSMHTTFASFSQHNLPGDDPCAIALISPAFHAPKSPKTLRSAVYFLLPY